MRNATMRREIEAQAEVLAAALPSLQIAVADLPLRGERILAGGCGDSYFAALAALRLFRGASAEFRAVTAQDLMTSVPPRPGDLVILTSISGGTLRTLDSAHTALENGATVVAITCNAESPLARAAHATLLLPYEPISRKTPHTLDFTMSLLALHAIAAHLEGTPLPLADELTGALRSAVARFDAPLAQAAAAITPATKMLLLGAGADRGLAGYGAAKFHEAGGLLALHEETENFVHGLNFVLEPGDLVVAFGLEPGGHARASEIVRELPRLNVEGLLVGTGSDASTQPFSLDARPPEEPYVASLIPQLLCFHAAERLELEVEQPRAGRPYGEAHLKVQADWMKGTKLRE